MLAVAAALALVVVACDDVGPPGESPVAPSGIQGTVVLGPTCVTGASPGEDAPVPCLTPYSAQLVVLDSENKVVARVTSGADGTFSVEVDPGEYVVTPATGSDSYPIANPVSVVVSAGQFAQVEINYDTGIR